MKMGDEEKARRERMVMEEKFGPVRSRCEALKTEANAVFGNIYTLSVTDHDKVAEYVFAKERVVTSLAETLGAFKNLHSIAYVEGSIGDAKRYVSLFEMPYPFDD